MKIIVHLFLFLSVLKLDAAIDFGLSAFIGGSGDVGSITYSARNDIGSDSPLISFTIVNFYSSTSPVFSDVPVGWSGTVLAESEPFDYTVSFSADTSNFFVLPGEQQGGFMLTVTKPSGSEGFNLVNLNALGVFENGLQSSDSIVGLRGIVIPEPKHFGLLVSMIIILSMCKRRRTNR